MSIGTMIDELYDLRTQRLAIEKQVEELKSRETATKNEILFLLREGNLEGATGEKATASISYKVKPSVTDWDAVYTYIRDNDMFALLHKAMTVSLWAALREDGVLVPGTEPVAISDLSLTKSKRS